MLREVFKKLGKKEKKNPKLLDAILVEIWDREGNVLNLSLASSKKEADKNLLTMINNIADSRGLPIDYSDILGTIKFMEITIPYSDRRFD